MPGAGGPLPSPSKELCPARFPPQPWKAQPDPPTLRTTPLTATTTCSRPAGCDPHRGRGGPAAATHVLANHLASCPPSSPCRLEVGFSTWRKVKHELSRAGGEKDKSMPVLEAPPCPPTAWQSSSCSQGRGHSWGDLASRRVPARAGAEPACAPRHPLSSPQAEQCPALSPRPALGCRSTPLTEHPSEKASSTLPRGLPPGKVQGGGFSSFLYESERQLGCSRLCTRTENGAAALTTARRGIAGLSTPKPG